MPGSVQEGPCSADTPLFEKQKTTHTQNYQKECINAATDDVAKLPGLAADGAII